MEGVIPQSWLTRKIDIETAELDRNYDYDSYYQAPYKYRYIESWIKFKNCVEPGDEIWDYNNDGFHKLAGRAGYAIVRNGIPIYRYQTKMS
jgi:hypothetical protein